MSNDDPWIAVDWGTSRLRAWRMDGATLRDAGESDLGMGGLSRDGFEPALRALIDGWRDRAPVEIVACGMVGSRQGWVEAPYRAVPCPPVATEPVRAETRDPGLIVWVVSGLRQDSPPDVMRGEETQIAGFLGLNPEFDGVLCLPGTHTKWVQISAGEVVSFQTFMTGELYAALQAHTVLRHSLGAPGWDGEAFDAAVEDGLAYPQKLAARLFGLRAGHLLQGQAPAVTRARLSGQLIGAELAAARPYWLGLPVAVIGSGDQSGAYVRALSNQGLATTLADADAMTRAGLIRARALLKEPTS
ncbi:MAG: 2-dehydro-3-deoxygalactonokinase [Rhodobacteraceae bacterium]|nr:2-dehydro-3-deoxygalactonokinase [Paracoccaceae bacterium]